MIEKLRMHNLSDMQENNNTSKHIWHAVTSNLLLSKNEKRWEVKEKFSKSYPHSHSNISYQCYLSRHKEELSWKRRTLDDDEEERSM